MLVKGPRQGVDMLNPHLWLFLFKIWLNIFDIARYTHTHTHIYIYIYTYISPREIWWTLSRNYTVLFLSRDVKNTKFNQYLSVDLTSLNMSNSTIRKPVMFWRWRRHGVALWRHGRGALLNCLLLATASNVNCWADVANHVTWLWQAGDTENFQRRITG